MTALANDEDSVAIGSGAVANGGIGSIALGSNSSVGRAAGAADGPRWRTSTDIGSRWYTWASAKNATEGTDGTWTSTIDTGSTVWQSNLGAVSIGTDGLTGTTYTRQLTGLAAGTQDTDAVNVAQWKNTMLATIGDAKEDSANTRYGSDGVARNVTRLVDEYLTLTGAADDGTTRTKDELTTDANIGTIVGDNKITFRLAKNLTGLDSVTTGNTKMESTGLTITNTDDNTKNITLNGTNGNAVIGGVTVGYAADGALKYTDALSGKVVNDAPGGTYVYGLSNTQWDGTTYVSGRAATEDQLYYLGNKAEQDINSLANQIGDGTFGLIADDGYSVQTNLGSQITVNGDGKNITTKTNDGALEIDLSNNLDLGNAGSVQMGNTTINNSGVTITHTDTDGNSNNVSLTENGLSNGGNAITNVGSGGTTETNAANIGDVKKLATTVTGGTNTTVTSKTNSNGGTEYQVDLKNKVTLGSNTAKQVILDGDNGLVKAGTNITLDGVNSHAYIGGVNVGHTAAGALSYRDASGNVVTDQTVPAGNYVYSLGNTTWDGSHYVSGRAATEDQLHTVQSNVNTAISNVDKHHTEVTVNGGTAPASDGTYTDGNLQIAQTTGDDGQKIYDLKLSDNLSIGGAGQNGQDGSNGHMDIKGEDGNSGVSLDGQDGISIKGSDGNSSVTISGKDGVDGVDGAEGHIGLNGKDGVTDIWTTAGTPGLNGQDGETMTRIVYKDPAGNTHEAATLDDGLKFGGDFGTASAVKLNKQVNVKGNAKNEADLTDGNIGVVSSQDSDNGQLLIKLNKNLNLGDTGSVNMGNTVINNDGVTITHTDTDGNSNNVSLTESGLSNGGNKITNIAAGNVSSDSTEAVNGSQLYAVESNVNQKIDNINTAIETVDKHHTEVTVNGGTAPASDGTYTDGNLQIAQTTGTDGQKIYDLKLSDNLSIGGVGQNGQDGSNGHMDIKGADGTSGVSLDGQDGISIKGSDGNSSVTISGKDGVDGVNGAEGHIGLNGKDGVTDIWTTAGTPGLNGQDGETMTRIVYKDPAGNTHEAATLDDGLKFGGDFGMASAVKLNKQVNVKGNAQNEADLTDGNIGVVSSQEGDNGQLLVKLNKDLNLGDSGSVAMGNTLLNGSGLSLSGADDNSRIQISQGNVSMGGQQIHNVANGTADTDAVNLSQLNEIKNAGANGGFGLAADDGNSVKKNLGETVTVKGDGTNISTKVDNGAIQVELKKDINLGTDGSVTAGETTINKDGVDTNQVKVGDITITKDGINGGQQQITNIGSGIDGQVYDTNTAGQENWNNAASVGDVHTIARDEASKAADAVKAKSGKNITVDADNKVNLNDDITLGDADDASKQVKIDGNKALITLGGKTVLGNQDGGGANPDAGSYLTGLDNKTWDASNIQSGRAATEDQLKVVDDKISGGRKFTGDDGQQLTVGLGQNLSLTGGAQADNLSDGNIGVVKNGDSGLSVKLSKDLKNLNSVTTGNTTIDNNGLTIKSSDADRTISIADGNVNMGGNTVSGVADGQVAPGSTDAVNGGQLWQRDQAINSLGGAVNKLDSRVNRVGAGAAALAALHPLDFDPDDKWDFAAGYGNYKDASAVAVGAYYRPNEDTMFSIGGSFGGGENMVNAGVSFKLGQGNHVSTSRVAMAKEIKDLRKEIEGLRSALADVAAGNRLDPTKTKLFPDIPQNHWAYNEIAQLYGNGIVQGYPDGNFGGDRMMTRYEFALMVYRQMQRGAALSDRIVNEFEPELERIRIDTITKDKDGNPVIQRVRVIKDRG